MAVNERTFIRILPESTGDRVGHYHTFDIEYTGRTRPFVVGETVTGTTAQGVVIKDTADNDVANKGVLSVILDDGYEEKSWGASESIQVAGSTVATVDSNGSYCVYIGKQTLAGGNNPHNLQYIDEQGQAYTRFAEGAPQLDAFHRLQVSQGHKLAEYIHRYDTLPNDYTSITSGSGSITHEPDTAGIVLSCGTASGDLAKRTSDEYHVYQAGVSQLIEHTVAVGDTGKSNVRRRWGYYDDENGVFFELDGTTFYVVLRSSTSGSPVDTRIAQANWNTDVLDGSGDASNVSTFNLDVSKDNIYWMDMQWLGAGSVRMGVIIDGQRIICHEFKNANNNSTSYMTTATLPVRYEQENTGTAASTSEMRFFCSVVKTEGNFNPFRRAFSAETPEIVTNVSSGSSKPLLAIRPLQNFKTLPNRSVIYPNTFEIYNAGPDPVMWHLVRGGTPSGGTWASVGGESVAEIYTSATAYTSGSNRKGAIVAAGEAKTVEFKTFEENRRGLRRKGTANASGTAQHVYAAHAIGSAAASAQVFMSINWDEVRG